jgi:hypothetical protein
MPDSIEEQVADVLGIPVENVTITESKDVDQERYGRGAVGDQPASTGEVTAKIIRRNPDAD